MQTGELILAEDFCTHHKVEFAFVTLLRDFGLIEITSIENAHYIPADELRKLEQLTRLHYDLNINLEGIDVITHLLEKLRSAQTELAALKQRLNVYE